MSGCSISTHEAQEGSSYRLTFTMLDEDGQPIPRAMLDALELTLHDEDSGTIINSRDAQNVINANNVTVHATSGLVTWAVRPADNPMVSDRKSCEVHIAHFRFTWATGVKAWSHQFRVTVCGIKKFAVA